MIDWGFVDDIEETREHYEKILKDNAKCDGSESGKSQCQEQEQEV